MLRNIPDDLLKEIRKLLDLQGEIKFSTTDSSLYKLHRKSTQERMTKALTDAERSDFNILLNAIYTDAKLGLAILQDASCKSILIDQKPQELPHWILGLAESQPALAHYVLNDRVYRDSLSAEENVYLINNYPDLRKYLDDVKTVSLGRCAK